MEWQAYYSLEPLGEERADLRMASVQTLLANINRDPKKGRRFKLDDFLFDFTPPSEKPKPDSETVKSKIKTLFKGMAEAKSKKSRKR